MSKKNRWVSPQIRHLGDHLGMAIIDVRSGNKVSALTNLKMATGIQKAMAEKDKTKRKMMNRLGKGFTFAIKVAVDQAMKSAIEGLKKDGKL